MNASFLIVTLAAALLSPSQASACSRDEQQLICPGDRVVGTNYSTSKSWGGRVQAVNPFRKTVSIHHDDGDLHTWDLDNVAIGVGCIQGYCVGDRAVGTNYSTSKSWGGKIVAVNPYRQTVVIRHDDGDLHAWDLQNVAIGVGCIQGYCVGDGVVATNYSTSKSWGGKIVAVNPVKGTVSIHHNDGDLHTWDLQNVANSEYCAEYGSSARKHRRFPFLDERSYRVKKWKYGLRR